MRRTEHLQEALYLARQKLGAMLRAQVAARIRGHVPVEWQRQSTGRPGGRYLHSGAKGIGICASTLPLRQGARVRIKTSFGDLSGTFAEHSRYADGLAAAWVDLDEGPLVFVPLLDLVTDEVNV